MAKKKKKPVESSGMSIRNIVSISLLALIVPVVGYVWYTRTAGKKEEVPLAIQKAMDLQKVGASYENPDLDRPGTKLSNYSGKWKVPPPFPRPSESKEVAYLKPEEKLPTAPKGLEDVIYLGPVVEIENTAPRKSQVYAVSGSGQGKQPPDMDRMVTPIAAGLRDQEFTRELRRQLLWLTAQFECGLTVRDHYFGERVPQGLPDHQWYRIEKADAQGVGYAIGINRGKGTKEQGVMLGSWREIHTDFYDEKVNEVLSKGEELTRENFPKIFSDAGLPVKAAKLGNAPLPAEAEKLLGEMREMAQFAALRLIHKEIQDKGESPELLGGLVRGYANLGLLTEQHWHSTPWVCWARAILVAQRMLHQKSDAFARWHLAYASALAGLHKLAIDQLAEAKVVAKAEPPVWVEYIDTFVNFDRDRFTKLCEEDDAQLLHLLEYLTIEQPWTPAYSIRAAGKFLGKQPECYRVHWSLVRMGGIGNLHKATTIGPAIYTDRLLTRLGEIPDLPETVRAKLNEETREADLYETLSRAGDPRKDKLSPSWDAFGQMLKETRFVQASHRLYFMAYVWSVGTEEEAEEWLKILQNHRYASLIEGYVADPRSNPQVMRKAIEKVAPKITNYRNYQLLRVFTRVNDESVPTNRVVGPPGQDWTYQGLVGELQTQYSDPEIFTRGGTSLPKISPHSPLAKLSGEATQSKVGNVVRMMVEQSNPDAILKRAGPNPHPVVHYVVAEMYFNKKQLLQAAEQYELLIQSSPEHVAFTKLANVYKEAGDEDKWLETLERSLESDDPGLGHARSRNEIAEYYMSKGDYVQAEPFAMEAAESFAAWALITAANCKAGLEKFEEADAIFHACADRYPSSAVTYFFKSKTLPGLNEEAAEKLARDYYANTAELNPRLKLRLAMFLFVLDEGKDIPNLIVDWANHYNRNPNISAEIGEYFMACMLAQDRKSVV